MGSKVELGLAGKQDVTNIKPGTGRGDEWMWD